MRTRMVIATFVAALSLAAVTAGSAAANPIVNLRAGLQLTEQGTPVTPGGYVYNENFVINGECLEANTGKLLNNGDAVDLIQLGSLTYDRCQSGSLSGAIKYIGLTDTGVAYIYNEPGMTLTTPSSCVYDFGLLQGNFTIGDETVVYISGSATGWRDRHSPSSCASTLTTSFNVGEYGKDDLLLETALVSGGGWPF